MKKIILIILVLLGLKTEAQVMYCDSISYAASTTLNYPITLSGTASGIPGTVSWDWQVCNANLCYTGSGPIGRFRRRTLFLLKKSSLSMILTTRSTIYSGVN